jgi:hypothetical protein
MNLLESALTARSYKLGKALRSASLRHLRLIGRPLALALFQLGAEPFSAAAIGYGCAPDKMKLIVPGEPRNRSLAFATLLEFARFFNPYFESPAKDREELIRGEHIITRALSLPQLIVPNVATIELLGRLGRRLAYLPVTGPKAVSPELIKLGQHLFFLARYASTPGQQLIVSMTDLLTAHWITAQSEMERNSLFSLDAFIEPPVGVNGFFAAVDAERYSAGPTPNTEDEVKLDPLVSAFNKATKKASSASELQDLLALIRAHYSPLVEAAWDLIWRCRARELTYKEAPSVKRRFEDDLEAYTQHIDWTNTYGFRRTRQTPRQAVITLRSLENATARLAAEEACDDTLRMLPYILENKAVQGKVIKIDLTYYEIANVRKVKRPLVTIHSQDPCLMPTDKELFWSARPIKGWQIHEVLPTRNGAEVTLKLNTSNCDDLPQMGTEACFSIHSITNRWQGNVSPTVPWTHEAPAASLIVSSIEE